MSSLGVWAVLLLLVANCRQGWEAARLAQRPCVSVASAVWWFRCSHSLLALYDFLSLPICGVSTNIATTDVAVAFPTMVTPKYRHSQLSSFPTIVIALPAGPGRVGPAAAVHLWEGAAAETSDVAAGGHEAGEWE